MPQAKPGQQKRSARGTNVICQVGGVDRLFWFLCPACARQHWFKVTAPEPHWNYNGNRVRPTVYEEILVTNYPEMSRCRITLTDGNVAFGDDSDHLLAGCVVPLVPITG